MVGLFAITSKVITSTEKNKLFQTFLQNGFEESRVSSFYFPALKVEVMEKVPFKIATRHRKSTYISHIVNNTATLAIRRRKLTDRLPAESTCFKWAHKTVWVYREEVRGEKFFPCWGLFIFCVSYCCSFYERTSKRPKVKFSTPEEQHLGLSSTQIRQESRTFRKLSSNRSNLKSPTLL